MELHAGGGEREGHTELRFGPTERAACELSRMYTEEMVKTKTGL